MVMFGFLPSIRGSEKGSGFQCLRAIIRLEHLMLSSYSFQCVQKSFIPVNISESILIFHLRTISRQKIIHLQNEDMDE